MGPGTTLSRLLLLTCSLPLLTCNVYFMFIICVWLRGSYDAVTIYSSCFACCYTYVPLDRRRRLRSLISRPACFSEVAAPPLLFCFSTTVGNSCEFVYCYMTVWADLSERPRIMILACWLSTLLLLTEFAATPWISFFLN